MVKIYFDIFFNIYYNEYCHILNIIWYYIRKGKIVVLSLILKKKLYYQGINDKSINFSKKFSCGSYIINNK